jgi:hypothetical protein
MTGAIPMIEQLPPDLVAGDAIPTRDQRKASGRARKAALASHASGRRRFVDPATCDRDYAAAEVEFMQAMQAYKQSSGRMFPTWSEVLEVLQGLGYEKVEPEGPR